ncbi:MAG: FAD-binding oxidoreductase [Pseudomonadota bacterium]
MRTEVVSTLETLRTIVGREHVLASPEQKAPYLKEWRGRYQSEAIAVVKPASTAEVSRVVSACAEARVGMVPIGGNTGLVGGAVSTNAQVLISLERMRHIRHLDALGATLSVDAGCVLAEAQQAAAGAGLLLPLSLSAEGSCQIGGNVSTGAGGLNVVRYGTVRDQVLGLEVVLPDGSVLNEMRALRKNTAGYDLKQWFIGAEGTLGIVTGVVLRLFPAPAQRQTIWLSLRNTSAVLDVFDRIRSAFGSLMTAFEFMTSDTVELIGRYLDAPPPTTLTSEGAHVLLELHGGALELGEDAVLGFLSVLEQEGLSLESVVATNESQRESLWRWRHNASAAQRLAGVCIKHDIGLPLPSIPSFLDDIRAPLQALAPGSVVVAFGHIGDGNLHFTVAQPPEMTPDSFAALRDPISTRVHGAVLEAGGTVSAEHGVGLAKRDILETQVGPVAINLMRSLKRTLDPEGLMNPGKVL